MKIRICIFITAMMLFLQQGYSQDIKIEIVPNSTPTNCLVADTMIFQTVIVSNLGSVDVYSVPLRMEVSEHDGRTVQITFDTLPQLQAGTKVAVTFAVFHIVPPIGPTYTVWVRAELVGDVNPQDNEDKITECVDVVYISGKVFRQDSIVLNKGRVELYEVDSNGQYISKDTVPLFYQGGIYTFLDVANGNYVIKAVPDSSENALPTYYGNTEFWDSASIVTIANNQPAYPVDITVISLSQLNGNSFISGYVGDDGKGQKSMSQKSVSNPAEDINVYLQKSQNSTWKTIARSLTNAEGYFEFKNVPAGQYRVILDVAGLTMDNPQVIDINDGDTVTGIEYEITEDGIVNKSGGEVGIVGARNLPPAINVYPNPTNYELRITNHELKEGEVVEIYSVVGQVVYQINKSTNQQQITKSTNNQINNIIIDVSGLASGMYYLKIGDKTVRFVKE